MKQMKSYIHTHKQITRNIWMVLMMSTSVRKKVLSQHSKSILIFPKLIINQKIIIVTFPFYLKRRKVFTTSSKKITMILQKKI